MEEVHLGSPAWPNPGGPFCDIAPSHPGKEKQMRMRINPTHLIFRITITLTLTIDFAASMPQTQSSRSLLCLSGCLSVCLSACLSFWQLHVAAPEHGCRNDLLLQYLWPSNTMNFRGKEIQIKLPFLTL